ncbi:hypothetical protein ANO11243_010300 [Dothideomycetidae sp. 11243]|nr:hypothetical protein ANO11243_010300 [fungal sp. No.11243]
MDQSSHGVELIPWDPNNEQQFERMRAQQLGLGWFPPITLEWKNEHLSGERSVYWIVVADDRADKDELVERHCTKFLEERGFITDTATVVYNTPRQPSGRTFSPVGHIGLKRIAPNLAAKLDLPPSTMRIVSLYVSWALQGSGIGAGAVLAAERIAVAAPYDAAATALETITKEFQMQDAYLKMIYDDKGLARPRQSNVEWYGKRGYEIVEGSEYSIPSESKVIEDVLPVVSLVQMWKSLK